MDNQEKAVTPIIFHESCHNCGTSTVVVECNRCLNRFCAKHIMITREAQVCTDCFSARFASSMTYLGETLYVITAKTHS